MANIKKNIQIMSFKGTFFVRQLEVYGVGDNREGGGGKSLPYFLAKMIENS